MALEERMASIEGGFEQMNRRFEDMNRRMDDIIQYMNQRFGEINTRMNHIETGLDDLGKKIDSHLKWTIGIMLGTILPMWVTIILAILLKA